MARLALNKSSLARESGQLSEYKRFLPSLELKRLQIMAERAKAKEAAVRLEAEYEERFNALARSLPMMANKHVPLEGLVDIDEELARLDKAIAKLDKEIGKLQGKLSNERFIANAPPEVIEKDRGRLDEARAKRATYAESAAHLRG